MKSLLIAAVLVLAPSAALAQVAAATLPNTLDRPSAQTPAAPPPVAPAAPANPKSEETLRAIISGAQAGEMNYDLMTPGLAAKVREQEATVTPLIQGFGALQAVRHVAIENGADLFQVTFASQATQWIIGLNAEGKVEVLLFRPAP
jgi:hypothetical protein